MDFSFSLFSLLARAHHDAANQRIAEVEPGDSSGEQIEAVFRSKEERSRKQGLVPSHPREDRRVERNLEALRLEPGRHNLGAMSRQAERNNGVPNPVAHTNDPRIKRTHKGRQSPAPTRSSAQVAGRHPRVQCQYAASAGLSGEPTSESNQPALQ